MMKEFDIKYDSDGFRKYIIDVAGERPFDCPHLRVLTEQVKTKRFNPTAGESQYNYLNTYEPGMMICLPRLSCNPGSGIECSVRGKVRLDEAGELELTCGWNGSRMRFELKGFEPDKK